MPMNNIDYMSTIQSLIEISEKEKYFAGYESGYRQALLDIKNFLNPSENKWEEARTRSYEKTSSPTLGDLLKQKIKDNDDDMF